MSMVEMLWLLPILFMVHEFEEIILIRPWLGDVKGKYEQGIIKPYKDFTCAESFSLAVFEEFLLIVFVTIQAYISGDYYVWMGMLVAITIHHFIHILMSFAFKGFVPGVITSFVILIGSIYWIGYIMTVSQMTVWGVGIATVAALVLFLVNLKILHGLMPWFDKILFGE